MTFVKARQSLSYPMLFGFLVVVMLLNSCVGTIETKPKLTADCHINWQQQVGVGDGSHSYTKKSDGLQVLVWNIHDRLLQGSIFSNEGHSEEEIACISDVASQYDLVLLQEAFVRPAQIARYTQHAWSNHPIFSEGGGGDWWPLRWLCEICLSPGLLILAQEQPMYVHSEPYEAFAGWNTELNKADDFFSKGFHLVQFSKFWVLNSHLDAGRGQDSINARTLQLRQVTAALKQLVPSDAPLLIGMDSNLRPIKEEQDKKILEEFLEANQLILIQQNGPDLIAVRNLRAEQPQVLPLKDVLSDHDALTAVIYPTEVMRR